MRDRLAGHQRLDRAKGQNNRSSGLKVYAANRIRTRLESETYDCRPRTTASGCGSTKSILPPRSRCARMSEQLLDNLHAGAGARLAGAVAERVQPNTVEIAGLSGGETSRRKCDAGSSSTLLSELKLRPVCRSQSSPTIQPRSAGMPRHLEDCLASLHLRSAKQLPRRL